MSRTAASNRGVPPILPNYKTHDKKLSSSTLETARSRQQRSIRPDQVRKDNADGSPLSQCTAGCCWIFLSGALIVLFFFSVFIGTSYLQQHLEMEVADGHMGSIMSEGLRTRNVIRKWGITHLHGVDIMKLGPPPAIASGSSSSFNSSLQSIYDFLQSTGIRDLSDRPVYEALIRNVTQQLQQAAHVAERETKLAGSELSAYVQHLVAQLKSQFRSVNSGQDERLKSLKDLAQYLLHINSLKELPNRPVGQSSGSVQLRGSS